MSRTKVIDFNVADETGAYDRTRAWIAEHFPTAAHVGMGYWKINRTVEIFYGVGKLTVRLMAGHTLTGFGL